MALFKLFLIVAFNIFSQALDTFNTAVVSPIYYVMFTTLTIVASVIMFKVIIIITTRYIVFHFYDQAMSQLESDFIFKICELNFLLKLDNSWSMNHSPIYAHALIQIFFWLFGG